MNLFESPQMNDAYERHLTPPDLHEVDDCEGCHKNDDHENPLVYQSKCDLCAGELARRACRPAFELKFPMAEVVKAQHWAEEHRYNHDSPEHLMWDAMKSGIIEPEKWEAL